MNKKLQGSFRKFKGTKEDDVVTFSGKLGIPLGGRRVVEVPNRKGHVFVRIHGNQSELIQAFNDQVANSYDMPVLVIRDGNKYRVQGRDVQRYQNWNSSAPLLPNHATQHIFDPSGNRGADPVWVTSQMFLPFVAFPSGTVTESDRLVIYPSVYYWNGESRYLPQTGSASFLPYKPTSSGSSRMALLYLDGETGNPAILSGSEFPAYYTEKQIVYNYVPTLSLSVGIPLVAVRLETGTTSIGWESLYDARPFYHNLPTGSAGGLVNPVDYIDFNATGSFDATLERRLSWNDDDGTLQVGMPGGNVVQQIGQEILLKVVNKSGSDMTNGQVVYVDDAQGQRPTVRLAKADAESTSANTIAMLTEDISNNNSGYATTFGLVRDLNTATFNDGDLLYLSPSTAGGLTSTKPHAPNHMVVVGTCVHSNAGSGIVLVHIQNGYELDELHDVKITSISDGDSLQYNSSSGTWQNMKSGIDYSNTFLLMGG